MPYKCVAVSSFSTLYKPSLVKSGQHLNFNLHIMDIMALVLQKTDLP